MMPVTFIVYSQVLPEYVGRNIIVSVVPHELCKASLEGLGPLFGRLLAILGL